MWFGGITPSYLAKKGTTSAKGVPIRPPGGLTYPCVSVNNPCPYSNLRLPRSPFFAFNPLLHLPFYTGSQLPGGYRTCDTTLLALFQQVA